MAKTETETERRRALTAAAIEAVGAQGSMDVTMADIAARAGASPGEPAAARAPAHCVKGYPS